MAAFLLLVLALVASGCSAAIDRKAVGSYAGQLRSNAAEAALLAAQAKTGSLPVSFTWLSSGELEQLVEKTLHELTSQMIAGELARPVHLCRRIGRKLLHDLEQLHAHANQPLVLARLVPWLKAQAKSADALFARMQ